MKWEIAAAVLFAASLVVFMYPVKQPEWKTEVLDSKHPERFVSIAAGPAIVYFNEKERGGVLYFASKGDGIMSDIDYYFNGRQWTSGFVDNAPETGMFLSAAADEKGYTHISYQDATMGNEKLMYALYDGTAWQKETVDDVNSGINVGMYSSISIIDGKPVIFYHTEQGRKFGYAMKENGQWTRKTLETGVGWQTSTVSCNGKVFAAYRSRDTQDIFFGTLENGEWNSRSLGIKTSSGLAMAEKGCRPYIAYFDDSTSSVRFLDIEGGVSYTVGSGKESRVSLAADNGGFYAVYHFDERGLYYAYSRDGKEWQASLLFNGRRDGWFNSVAVANGNVYVALLNYSSLMYAEYNTSSVNAVKTVLWSAAALLFAAGSLILIKKYTKIKVRKNRKLYK